MVTCFDFIKYIEKSVGFDFKESECFDIRQPFGFDFAKRKYFQEYFRFDIQKPFGYKISFIFSKYFGFYIEKYFGIPKP